MLCSSRVFRCCVEYVYKPAIALGEKRLGTFTDTHFLPRLSLCKLQAAEQKKTVLAVKNSAYAYSFCVIDSVQGVYTLGASAQQMLRSVLQMSDGAACW